MPSSMCPATDQSEKLRVLIVEDDADSALTLAVLLRTRGHTPTIARDGLTALSLAMTESPDVILLDLGLPGIDGLEVARRIKARPARKTPLLVAISGYGREEDRRKSAAAGLDLHLVKPADPRALLDLLDRFHGIIAGVLPDIPLRVSARESVQ